LNDDMSESTGADLWIDHNGCLTERRLLGGQAVIVHYDDIPESDITVVDGIRVTTPLRTVIAWRPTSAGNNSVAWSMTALPANCSASNRRSRDWTEATFANVGAHSSSAVCCSDDLAQKTS